MSLLFILLFLVALAILGPLFGSDSRDGRDWLVRLSDHWSVPTRSPNGPTD